MGTAGRMCPHLTSITMSSRGLALHSCGAKPSNKHSVLVNCDLASPISGHLTLSEGRISQE